MLFLVSELYTFHMTCVDCHFAFLQVLCADRNRCICILQLAVVGLVTEEFDNRYLQALHPDNIWLPDSGMSHRATSGMAGAQIASFSIQQP
jgi:hypothetical protein